MGTYFFVTEVEKKGLEKNDAESSSTITPCTVVSPVHTAFLDKVWYKMILFFKKKREGMKQSNVIY